MYNVYVGSYWFPWICNDDDELYSFLSCHKSENWTVYKDGSLVLSSETEDLI